MLSHTYLPPKIPLHPFPLNNSYSKKQVWFSHKQEVWALGDVTDPGEEEDTLTVSYSGKEVRARYHLCWSLCCL